MTRPWGEQVLARLAVMDAHLRRRAAEAQREPHEAGSVTAQPYAKFPARDFNYLTELEELDTVEAASEPELLDEIAGFFRGAQRPESPYCLFNLNVLPTVDATAAACLSVMHNVNGLMDMFAGESLLVEQKVARTIGRWAGWPESMGISCNGGKVTMHYALRCAIARAQPSAARDGLAGRLVVLCSAGAHYSVEHVAASVGIGASNCVRIPLDQSGGMSPDALWAAMQRAHAEGARIAAVVCCGGTVIDFCCDDTTEVGELVDRFVTTHGLGYTPYLHFDSVIGWLYLAFRDLTAAELEDAVSDSAARARVAEVVRRCAALERFDSLGVDFHKTGLCPYASSCFIARDRRFMDELGAGDYAYGESDFQFGSFRAYRYTIENSRPTHGILSAWVNLRGMGREGLRNYLVGLHRGRAGLEAALSRHGRFTTLNDSSLGWEVVFDIPFEERLSDENYGDVAVVFMEHCWRLVRDGEQLPLFSIIPEFHVERDPARSRFAFLLYPMRDQPASLWDSVVDMIALELARFQEDRARVGEHSRPEGWQKPIR
jgi:glutamate/tyrosine decarboxylase-like PLP-dependent enzyme